MEKKHVQKTTRAKRQYIYKLKIIINRLEHFKNIANYFFNVSPTILSNFN